MKNLVLKIAVLIVVCVSFAILLRDSINVHDESGVLIETIKQTGVNSVGFKMGTVSYQMQHPSLPAVVSVETITYEYALPARHSNASNGISNGANYGYHANDFYSDRSTRSGGAGGGSLSVSMPVVASRLSQGQGGGSVSLPSESFYGKINPVQKMTDNGLANMINGNGPGVLPPADGDGDDDLIELPIDGELWVLNFLVVFYLLFKLTGRRKIVIK